MNNFISNYTYSVAEYCNLITGEIVDLDGVDDEEEFLEDYQQSAYQGELWNFPVNEIEEIQENDLKVVLVACNVTDAMTGEITLVCRWAEVPEFVYASGEMK